MKRLLALIEAPEHVCYRYRIAAFCGALAEAGWELEAQPLDGRLWHRLAQLRAARRYHAVLIQRRLLPLSQLLLLRKSARSLIYDFDDAIFHRDSYSPKGTWSWSRMTRFWSTITAADAVIAGNTYLADQAECIVAAERVVRVPTCVDLNLYPLAARRAGTAVSLVWIGQRSTLPCLDCARPALEAVAHECPGIELRVISDVFPRFGEIQVVQRKWSAATEAAEIASADVGISWLPNDPWSRGKCGLKVLQYMAAGLPVVANSVGPHRDIVVPEVTGFLCDTPQQWADAIRTLAQDPVLRRQMGDAGRARVAEQFDVSVWGARFVRIIEDATAWREGRRTDLPRPHFSSHIEVPA
ncbi:MAG: glycosyltransferase family 4 protein [Pirellulales bacterium]|nr:glycosyltransferase family 4 protein [Pirellulales bacterium]